MYITVFRALQKIYKYEQTGGKSFTKVITDRWTPKRFFPFGLFSKLSKM